MLSTSIQERIMKIWRIDRKISLAEKVLKNVKNQMCEIL